MQINGDVLVFFQPKLDEIENLAAGGPELATRKVHSGSDATGITSCVFYGDRSSVCSSSGALGGPGSRTLPVASLQAGDQWQSKGEAEAAPNTHHRSLSCPQSCPKSPPGAPPDSLCRDWGFTQPWKDAR